MYKIKISNKNRNIKNEDFEFFVMCVSSCSDNVSADKRYVNVPVKEMLTQRKGLFKKKQFEINYGSVYYVTDSIFAEAKTFDMAVKLVETLVHKFLRHTKTKYDTKVCASDIIEYIKLD